ncbi:MAG: Hsp20/alpha crystallin family protein [Bacteroidota bacterium]
MSLIKRNHRMFPSFDQFWNDFFNDETFLSRHQGNLNTVPAVNVREQDHAFQLEVAAPGMKKEDFDIALDDQVLSISAKQESSSEEGSTQDGYTRREFRYAQFRRSFNLPDTVDSEQISAKYEDGVLYLLLPKRAEAQAKPARTIEIG